MLVGRLDELAAAAEHLTDRVPLLVVGEAGIGKTALLREAARSSGRRVFEGGGLATLRWAGYLALERALGRPLADGDIAAVAAQVARRVNGGILIVDDLHWVDAQTLAVLPLVAGRIALLAGLRTGDPSSAEAWATAEAAGFESLALEPLGDAEARALVRRRHENLPERSLEQVVERARGNPFLLEELAAGEPSESLRVALLARLRRCSSAARRALELLALLERPAERELLGEGIVELVETGLVLREGERYRVRHDLLAQVVREELGADGLRRLHRRLARTLTDPGEIARHHQEAGDLRRAHARALEAAQRARRPGERARHLGLAAACAAGPAADKLRLRAAEALLEAGEHAEAERLASAVEPGDPRRDAEAALFRARAHWAAGSPDEARELIDAGLALVGGTGLPVEAKLLAAAAEFPLWDWNAPVAVQCAGEAWELARRAGLDESRFRCLYGRALYIAGSRDCLGHLAAATEQAKCDGGGEAECEAAAALAAANHSFGRPGPARRLARRMVGRARTLRLRGWELYFRYLSVFQGLVHRGAYEDAIEELSLLLQEPGLGPVRDEVAAYLALALADVGRDREAGALLERSLPAAHSGWGRALLLYILAETHWTAGRAGEALAAADACVSTGCASTLLPPWVAATRSWALVDTGGAPGRGARSVPLPLNAGADLAIEALQRFNDPARMLEAERLFMAAARHCAGLLLRSELRCLWAAGEAARRAGELERARERLLSVEERARAHGLIPLLGRIQKSLRDLGVRRAAPRASSAYGLTDREREMLALVGGGCTSAEIARRLGLSAGTVDSAVRSAMTKLNASTRIQAALLSAGETQPQQLSGTRPLIVVEPGSGVRAAAVEELSGAGWIVHEGWPSTRAVRSVSGQRVVFAGDVSGAEDAAAALVAAARGAGVVVELRAEPAVTEGFLEDLRHLGPVEHRRANAPIPATLLSPEQSRLLTLLADGRSIPEAASELYISRRTAERRLATARRMLGVRRTSEAVLLSQFSS